MSSYRPSTAILELGGDFYDAVAPAAFPKAIPRFLNERAAGSVGLDLSAQAWEQHFCRFEPLEGSLGQPLALRYHGHQFRQYNPDIGDGRGFLFAQLHDERERLLDFGTKGSGQTPYSRFGDGRLTLKGGVREVLATEMLEALGVETSKSFALFETGEELQRNDEPSPTRSAVLTRLSHGHIRIGTFQRCAFFKDAEGIERLCAYSLKHLFDEDAAAGAHRLFELASQATARLAASYLAAGFVHGVLNSDNINATGESFDYGPWRFTPEWDEGFVAAYFDHAGLYAFGVQPEAIQWDLAQLAGCLSLVAERGPLEAELNRWGDHFQSELVAALVRRLGVPPGEDDVPLASAILAVLRDREESIDRFFFGWRGGVRSHCKHHLRESEARLEKILKNRDLDEKSRAHDYWSDEAPCTMHIAEVEEIWARIAEDDDWSLFEAKIAAIRRMGEAMGSPAT
jgi:serine/tyrosine/threonine adenylyltransferase